ncbi:MAG: hypothetical protein WC867_06740 [Candidatus Pacearchaeota archaeon]|jgi:hypothetical protein
MRRKPYVGITGPINTYEVEHLVTLFESNGYNMESDYLPMIGFLVSYKTLTKQPVSNRRYPNFLNLRDLLRKCENKIFTMIHYNSRESDLADQIDNVFNGLYEEDLCRSLQLNIPSPNKSELIKIKRKMPEMEIVFQANRHILNSGDSFEVSKKISEYSGLIDYILIDPSGGRGQEFDMKSSVELYFELREKIPEVQIGFAGGFNTENVNLRVNELIERIGNQNFSIDAEGGLRDKLSSEYGDDLLNLNKVKDYLFEASLVLK